MNEMQQKIQAIMETLQSLNIKAEYETMNRLLGCLQLLGSIKNDIADWYPANQSPTKVENHAVDPEGQESENTEEA